ncbi:MAG: tRNA (N6-isopentenyl adenosine(37)-C2)-methylthiotransferase MiaB [Desulfofustis sp.]|nr:tRNA (N6-isopentenyl adenosine(37)-C2)-methylthiotransferase MiaB [Desulfofustis sp.]
MIKNSFYIKTFGCQMNIRDSEIMAQKLSEAGYVETSELEDASLILLNTCSVRGKAEQKVFSMLGSLRKHKEAHPDLTICVAGCVAQQEGQRIIDRMDHVDLVIGTQHIYNLPQLLKRSSSQSASINLSDSYEIPRYSPKIVSAPSSAMQASSSQEFLFSRFVTIMQGCNNFCTYCVVPYTRGREVSRKATDIISEIKTLVKAGTVEITLLGQNVNSYGTTNQVADPSLHYSFPDLLTEVSTIDGLQRLRFTTSHPKDLSDRLIDCFAQLPNLCPQIHLPVQSGSDRILKRMNRKYTIDDYLERVDRLKTIRPDIAITTDIIVGFPGETEEDFQQTMNLLETVRYHGSFSFKYSDRPETSAAGFDGKLSEKEKGGRLQLFQKRQDRISLERNREYLESTLAILVETNAEGKMMGRTVTNHIVHVEQAPANLLPGSFTGVKIVHAGQHSLKGVIAPYQD